jgi:hypothetical protein
VVPFEYPLDELMMVNWLGRGRGVELHACGVVDHDGQGVIFCGQSGAGKSTTGRLWQAAGGRRAPVVLSDDRIIVREEQGTLFMYGTPWHGEAALARAARVPCKGLLLLEQARQTRLVPLPGAAAVSRLFACSFVPFHDAAAVGFTLDFLAALVGQLPCLGLRFRRDGSFVPLVRAALAPAQPAAASASSISEPPPG